jgi:hypothetical protein
MAGSTAGQRAFVIFRTLFLCVGHRRIDVIGASGHADHAIHGIAHLFVTEDLVESAAEVGAALGGHLELDFGKTALDLHHLARQTFEVFHMARKIALQLFRFLVEIAEVAFDNFKLLFYAADAIEHLALEFSFRQGSAAAAGGEFSSLIK